MGIEVDYEFKSIPVKDAYIKILHLFISKDVESSKFYLNITSGVYSPTREELPVRIENRIEIDPNIIYPLAYNSVKTLNNFVNMRDDLD
jgi:hypothetical protein